METLHFSAPANKVYRPAADLQAGGRKLFARATDPDIDAYDWRPSVADDLGKVPAVCAEAFDVLVAVGSHRSQPRRIAIAGERQWYGWPDESRFAVIETENGGGAIVAGGDYVRLALGADCRIADRADGEAFSYGVPIGPKTIADRAEASRPAHDE